MPKRDCRGPPLRYASGVALHRTDKLEGELLDAAVMLAGVRRSPSPSTDPAIAWELMREYRIDVFHTRSGGVQTSIGDSEHVSEGRDELEAIMRCFVLAKLGEEVELPGPQ